MFGSQVLMCQHKVGKHSLSFSPPLTLPGENRMAVTGFHSRPIKATCYEILSFGKDILCLLNATSRVGFYGNIRLFIENKGEIFWKLLTNRK